MEKKFKLAAVLRVRKILEKQKKREFGEAMSALMRARSEKVAELRALKSAQDEYNRRAQKDVNIQELKLHETHILSRRIEVKFKDMQVRDAERSLEEKRRELMEVTRNREVVDKLHERFRRRVEYELNKEEEKQLGEIALGRFVRRRAQATAGGGNE